jgi:hypothetical protein
MRFVYDNKIDNLEASAVTALSEVTGYEVINVQDQRLTTKWHSNSATTQTVIFTFASSSATIINTAAIISHNIISGTSVLIEANDTNSWGTPSFSTTMTVIEGEMMLKSFANISNKYWRFYINQGSLEIGRLWLSNYITIDPSSLNDFTVTKKRSDTVLYNKHRQKFSSPGVSWRAFSLNFPPTNETMIALLNSFIDTVGIYKSWIFCNFNTDRSYTLVKPCYVSLTSDIEFSHTSRQKYQYTLEFEEDL